MMTVYRPIKSSSGKPSRRRLVVGLLVGFVLLLGLSRTSFLHRLTGWGVNLFKPFWAVGSGLDSGLTGAEGLFSSKIKLAEENAQLRATVREQAISLLNQSAIEEENATLRQILNRESPLPPLTVGRLLSQGLQFPFSTALLDAGTDNVDAPLTPGLVVVAGGTVALGELIEVYPRGAKLQFYSTPNDRLSAALGENHIPVELVGRGGGNFITSLPRDLVVTVGDRVTITIAEHEFLLATVSEIESTAGDSFQEIFLRSPVNISQLTWVELYEP